MQKILDITPEGITQASGLIKPEFLNTPLHRNISLAATPSLSITLKDETASPICCFKGRGTDYFAHTYAATSPVVVCASAGNFGQGLAMAMHRRGGKAIVFAAKNASPLKITRMKELGGEVILSGHDFDEANDAARMYANEKGLPFVEDAAFAEIAEGAGTLAKEMTESEAEFDAIYIPVGGGALINGVGTWLKQARPDVKVIGVCAEGAPSLAISWKERKVVETATVNTFADGIAIRTPALPTIQHMMKVVDDFVLVSDAEILNAMRVTHCTTGIRPEPSGAAGVAAIIKDAEIRGIKHPASLICGANVPDDKMTDWFGAVL
jgi:threonine dehydratase